MLGFPTGVRVLAAVAIAGVLLAGCSGAPEPEPPAPEAAPPPAAAPPAPGAVPSPTAVSIAQASADPRASFVLAAGAPAGCLETPAAPRAGAPAPTGRAVLGPCRPVGGQAWSFRAMPDGTYRVANRTPGGALCFEGTPPTAPDGAANAACGPSPGQVWYVAPTAAGFHRLRTAASPNCLAVTPAPPAPAVPGAPGPPAVPGVAMVPCEPLESPPGAARSAQDWELLPAPPLPALPRPAPKTTPKPKPRPKPRATATDGLFAEVNATRTRAGCGPVKRDATLDRAAEGHARWMAAGGAFDHTGKGGSSPTERIRAAGWTGSSTGENIAHGQTSADEVLTDWMNSPGHRRNILDCEFGSMGLAKVGSGDDPMWVQTFGGN